MTLLDTVFYLSHSPSLSQLHVLCTVSIFSYFPFSLTFDLVRYRVCCCSCLVLVISSMCKKKVSEQTRTHVNERTQALGGRTGEKKPPGTRRAKQ